MHITLKFSVYVSAAPVRAWLKSHFSTVLPARLHGDEQTWKVSDEHSLQTIEDDIIEDWPLDWPMRDIFVSDENGNEVE